MTDAVATTQPAETLEFQNRQSPTAASAAERRRLVAAATQAAVDRLLAEIEAQPVNRNLTVGQLVRQLKARPALREMLAGSPQLGRARFPLPGTAEVQLQAAGEDVAAELVELTRAAGADAPIAPAELERGLRSWRGKTFVATGGSAAADVAPELRFPPDRVPPSWLGVTDEGRRQAVAEANMDLVNKFMDSAGKIEVAEHVSPSESTEQEGEGDAPKQRSRTLEDVFNTGTIGSEMRAWLSEQPYRRLEFGAGRKVEVKLAIEPLEWVEQLRVSMADPDSGFSAMPPEEWEKLKQRLIEHARSDEVADMVGRGEAADSLENAPPALQLPNRPPDWTRLPVTVEASAPPVQGPPARKSTRQLMTRNAATELGRRQLRARLEGLPVSEGQTLGQIAQQHPNVAALLDSAVKNARATNARYGTDGSATVQVSVNPELLWNSLQRYSISGSASPPQSVTAPAPAAE